MKKQFAYFAILITIFSACSKSSDNSTGGNNTTGAVTISGFAFNSNDLHVTAGTTVTWTNNDAATHTVTADDGSFSSGNITPGKTFSHTFSAAGTVHYHCNIHPMMTAEVIVQ